MVTVLRDNIVRVVRPVSRAVGKVEEVENVKVNFGIVAAGQRTAYAGSAAACLSPLSHLY